VYVVVVSEHFVDRRGYEPVVELRAILLPASANTSGRFPPFI
jgi:hypothetical protein